MFILKQARSKKRKTFIILVAILVLIVYGFIIIDRNIKPTVLAICEAKARMIATQAINDAVRAKINEDINYNDLIFVKYDNQGKITMMQANTVLMNSIASEVALEVQENMRQIAASNIKIPLGNALNSQILSQWGPKININIVPQGTVTVDFTTEFEESGINQTRHKVFLTIKTNVRIIVPLTSDIIQVSTNVPIAETVIVGDVPQYYIKVPENEILNVIPD
nr:sporulation protein YunB [Caloranaerobacter azorensis]